MSYFKIQTKTNCYLDANLQMIARVMVHDFKRVFNVKTCLNVFVIFRKGTAVWCGEEENWKELTNECIALVLRNPEIAELCRKQLFEESQMFLEFLKVLGTTNLSALNNKEFWQLYEDYCEKYRTLYIWGEPLAHFVNERLTNLIRNQLQIINPNITYKESNLLATPDYTSFIKREEIDLLRIAVETRDNKSILPRRIKEHTQKYFWIPFDYGVAVWDEKKFEEELNKIDDSDKRLEEINNQSNDIKEMRNELEQKYNLNENLLKLIEAQKIFAIIMDYKKEVFTKAHVVFLSFTKELEKRLHLTEAQAKMIPFQEAKECLLNNKEPNKEWLNTIIEFSVGVVNDEGYYEFIIGEDAQKKADIIEKRYNHIPKEKSKELTGYPASKGIAIGRVRVLTDAKCIDQLEKGEILVCHMTSPDFVVGMKKAAAIITDEGGITCHAAIISRELNIPCIIGTKIATRVLKTGDKVKVDADKGIVEIMSRL